MPTISAPPTDPRAFVRATQRGDAANRNYGRRGDVLVRITTFCIDLDIRDRRCLRMKALHPLADAEAQHHAKRYRHDRHADTQDPGQPPGGATHWTTRTLAAQVGVGKGG